MGYRKPPEVLKRPASTDEVNSRGTVPRANGTHAESGAPGAAGEPVVQLARTNVTSGGGDQSRGGVLGCAARMYCSQIGSAVTPPVASYPIGLKLSRPTHTPVT